MQRLSQTIHAAGAKAMGAIMYGISPVHTDEWFAARVREMASWPSISGIYVEDAPGILSPERARTLVPALIEAAGDKPIEFQFHNNTGMGAYNYVIALEAGARCLHTCARSMANGPSLPSTEQTLENIRWLGHTHSVDESVASLRALRGGIRFMPEWDKVTDMLGRLGATVEGLDFDTLYSRKKRRTMGRVAMLAVHAAE